MPERAWRRQNMVYFECPGCQNIHGISIAAPGPVWTWNRRTDLPTITPSILCNGDYPQSRCHSFVENGQIRFLGDCFHGLANQTVDLPDIPDWAIGEAE